MTGPDAAGRADDAPTMPGIAPVWQERPELGIPGLDYMPPPRDGRPPIGGVHRRDRPRPPWRWLTAGVALVVLSALALTWLLAGTTDVPRRPRATAPATDPLASDLPSAGVPPLPTESGFPGATSSPGASSPGVTMSPSASASPSPTASPRPQQVRVPDVLGDRQGAAEAALRAAGFATAVQLVPAPSPRQARRVISQRPTPGQLALRGSVVTLVVGDR